MSEWRYSQDFQDVEGMAAARYTPKGMRHAEARFRCGHSGLVCSEVFSRMQILEVHVTKYQEVKQQANMIVVIFCTLSCRGHSPRI